jgi:hypothetical protein
MGKMDYTVAGTAKNPVIEPLSEQAKIRTPASVTFENRKDALDFMLNAQIEGFRFSGANLLDPAQKNVKTRYFLRRDNQLVEIGHDWGPRVPVVVVGDLMPLRDENGTVVGEAEVEAILDGDHIPSEMGCTIAFVLKERTR